MSPALLRAIAKESVALSGPYTELETLLLGRALCVLKEKVAGYAEPDEEDERAIGALIKKVVANSNIYYFAREGLAS